MSKFSVSVRTPRVLLLFILAMGATGWQTSARACSVPVFRYALEHWRSDPYQVVFFHRGELSPSQEELMKRLSAGRAANVEVHPVNLDDADPDDPKTKDDLALWKEQETETLPWMVVKYPLSIQSPATIWAGEATKEAVDGLLDSPKRQEIAKGILAGDTAVWLLVESGDQEKDAKAYQRLRNELKRCEQDLKLPAPDPQDVADGLISVDQASLQVRFSIVRLSRDDAKEQAFIAMLLDSEQGLRDEEFQGQPMAFPIFGRGRALYAIIGEGINREVIFDACRFLVGPCSCQVKNQNPGTDLLMAVNWDQSITPQIAVDQSLPPLPVIGKETSEESKETAPVTDSEPLASAPLAKEETEEIEKENADAPASESAAVTEKTTGDSPQIASSRVMTTMLICLAAAVGGIAVMSVFLMKS